MCTVRMPCTYDYITFGPDSKCCDVWIVYTDRWKIGKGAASMYDGIEQKPQTRRTLHGKHTRKLRSCQCTSLLETSLNEAVATLCQTISARFNALLVAIVSHIVGRSPHV